MALITNRWMIVLMFVIVAPTTLFSFATLSSYAGTNIGLGTPSSCSVTNDSTSTLSVCSSTTGSSYVSAQASGSTVSGELLLNVMGNAAGSETVSLTTDAELDGNVLVTDPNAKYISISPNLTGELNIACSGDCSPFTNVFFADDLSRTYVATLSGNEPGSLTPKLNFSSVEVPIVNGNAMVFDSLYLSVQSSASSFIGEFRNSYTIAVLDQNGNAIPAATYQADFGTTNSAAVPEVDAGSAASAFALLTGSLLILCERRRRGHENSTSDA